ncbi:MAG: class I SAM-dependent methyltransferase [Phycisphaerae bacterium]
MSDVEKEPAGLESWFAGDGAAAMRALGVEAGWRVLDFGCGPGRFAVPLAQVVGPEGEVIAADKKVLSIHRLRKNAQRWAADGRLRVERRDAMDVLAEQSDGSLDAVLLFDVLQHIDELPALLEELVRAVRPGGMAILYPSEGPHPGRVDVPGVSRQFEDRGFRRAGEARLRLPHAGHLTEDIVYLFSRAAD